MDQHDWAKQYEFAVAALDALDNMAFQFPADDDTAQQFIREYNQAVAHVMTVRDWSRQRQLAVTHK